MQDNFVDHVLSSIWLAVTSAFAAFFDFVGSMGQNYGFQNGGFFLVSLAGGMWLVFSFFSFHNIGIGRVCSSSFVMTIFVNAAAGICKLFGFGCLLAGLFYLGRYYI